MTKLTNVVVLDSKALTAIANGEKVFDNRLNNTGRPVNKKSARQARLAKQALYASLNEKFISGNAFKVSNGEYKYSVGKNGDISRGCIYNTVTGYVCNIEYVGRTKVKGYTFVLGKKVNVELNLKTLEFVS